jgi:hypothetical protein
MHCSSFLFGTELYMFRTDLLSIVRSLNAVFIAIVHLIGFYHKNLQQGSLMP